MLPDIEEKEAVMCDIFSGSEGVALLRCPGTWERKTHLGPVKEIHGHRNQDFYSTESWSV
jgi:hypothetical protein